MTINLDFEIANREKTDQLLAQNVLEELIAQGVVEFCICAGSRNAPLVYPLIHSTQVRTYYWSEERSAAFFALGRIKSHGKPVAVVTTSGTAAAELLPAAIEAFYTSLPLVLLTADRPRRFRGSGAPQAVEQVGIFSHYVHEMYDLAKEDSCSLQNWTQQGPLHLNICFEEPKDTECREIRIAEVVKKFEGHSSLPLCGEKRFENFLCKIRFPFVIVGELPLHSQEAAVNFLLHLNAPVYLEAASGLREDPRLTHLQICRGDKIWEYSTQFAYPIDGILRLGSVPTIRLWRDLENTRNRIIVCSISENPFSGLSENDVIHTSLKVFFEWGKSLKNDRHFEFANWKKADHASQKRLIDLFNEEPESEASLIHQLSNRLPSKSKVYLGNSLPIREWDLAATYHSRAFKVACNRGACGIDGQMATFFGYCSSEQENWGILGDLTVLYDLVAPWILTQMSNIKSNIVLINNGGGRIFAKLFADNFFQNNHSLTFESIAKFWKMDYERWNFIPQKITESAGNRFIELVPNQVATERFLQKLKGI